MTAGAMILNQIKVFGVGSPAVRSLMLTNFKSFIETEEIFLNEIGSPMVLCVIKLGSLSL